MGAAVAPEQKQVRRVHRSALFWLFFYGSCVMTLTQCGPKTSPSVHRAMPASLSPSEFYRAEAARLRDMAASFEYHDVGEGLRCIAREYVLLADQRDGLLHHRFGEPLRRPS